MPKDIQQLILSTMKDVVYVRDMEKRLTYINPAAEERTGYTAEEAVGRKCYEIFGDADQLCRSVCPVDKGISTGAHILHHEGSVETRSGDIRRMKVSISPIVEEEGPAGAVVVMNDVTDLHDIEKTRLKLVTKLEHEIRERKQAEEVLREREAFIQVVLDNLPIGIAVNSVDPAVVFEYMNENFPRFYQASKEALVNQDEFWDAVYEDPEFREQIKTRVLDDCASGDPERMHWVDVPITRKGQETRFITARNTPVPDKKLMISTVWDVTKRKQAEDALRESEERFRSMFENMGSGVAVYEAVDDGVDFVFKDFNPSAEGIAHLSRDTALGNRLLDLFPHMDESGLLNALRRVWKTGRPEHLLPFYYKDDLREGWRENRIYKLSSSEIVTVFEDVTELKMRETELRQALDRISFHVNNSPLGVIEWEGGIRIKSWSSQAESIFGWTEEELVGKNWEGFPFVYPEDEKIVARQIGRLFSGEDPFNTYQNRNYHKDGSIIYCQWFNSPLRDSKGKVLNILSQVYDMTKLHEALENLSSAKEVADSANFAKSEFLATMSHEIRTPLNGVLGMLQILQENPLDGGQKECVEIALDSGKNLTRIIGDILDLSRIESGKVEVQEIEFTISEAMHAVQGSLMSEAASKHLPVNYHIDPSMPSSVMGDIGRLRQVLFNLVGNAIKFTDKGEVNVRAYSGGKEAGTDRFELCFEVSDTGIGIPEDKLEMIYEPFTQVDGSYTRKHGGTGLGLSIVKRLTQLMEGELHVESEVGVGTTFRVCIPVKTLEDKSLAEEKLSATVAEVPEPAPSLRILLAEDDLSNQLVVEHLLEKQGHTLTCVGTGKEALEAVKFERYDLVLMDIQMPEMDGTEATVEIRKDDRFKKLPIIALTAHAMAGDKERFLEAGMDDYLSKPLDVEELKKVLARVVDGHILESQAVDRC